MRRTLALLVLTVALAAPTVAEAAERRIAEGEAYGISTYRGWVTWTVSDNRVVLWRGSPRAFVQPDGGASGVRGARIGSDARGRTSIVFVRCATAVPGDVAHYRDCKVVRRLLATGAESTMLVTADSYDLYAPELDQGSLAVTFGRRAAGERPTLREFSTARGELRLSGDNPADIDSDRGRLVYTAFRGETFPGSYSVARAIDLRSRRPRYRTLAAYDGSDEDGRIPGASVTSFDGAASDGRYAYWLRTTLRDSVAASTFEVWRADLDTPKATVTKTTLERWPRSIAVSGGRIYYTGDPEVARGVFEVTDPTWVDTGLTTPVNS